MLTNLKKLFLSVFKKSGSTLPYSTKEKTSYAALSACLHLEKKSRRSHNLYPYVLTILASLLFFSCGSATRPDPAPAYSDGNYHSVEFELCGKYFFGVGGCQFRSGASTATNLKIQGFGSGEVSIFSDLCHIDWKQRYSSNEVVQVQLATLYEKLAFSRLDSCTLKVIVSPDPLKNSEQAVFPRVGEVAIEVASPGVDILNFPTLADQVRESELQTSQVIPFPSEAGQYLLTRCSEPNIAGDFAGAIELPDFSRKLSCKYQLAVKTVSGKKYSGIFFRNVFKKDTILLARPKVTRETNKICIEADPQTTSFLSINEKWTTDTSLCYDGKGPYKIRVWTVKRNYYEEIK